MSVEQVYDEVVRELSEAEQVQLASLIMWKAGRNGHVEYSGKWSDEDLRDFTAAGDELIRKRLDEDDLNAGDR